MRTSTLPPSRPLILLHGLLLCGLGLWAGTARANDPAPEKPFEKVEILNKKKLISTGTADVNTTSAANPKEVGNQVREALGTNVAPNKKLTVVVSDKSAASRSPAPVATQASRAYIQARAAALTGLATSQELSAPRTWELGNAAINRLLWTPDALTLVGWSDTRHLDETALDESSV